MSSPALRNVFGLFGILLILWIPALLDLDAVRSAASLFSLAKSANPYFVPNHAWQLYFWMPLVVISACVLLLSPGLLLSIALGVAKDTGQWISSGFALSLLLISSTAAIAQAISGRSVIDESFALLIVICSVICFGIVLIRAVLNPTFAWRFSETSSKWTILSILLGPFFILVVMVPKFLWENFNGDGVHAFESSRLLLIQPLPFWPSNGGAVAVFPGITSMLFAYPTSWFIRLFGEIEASARFPFLIYLAVLFAILIGIINYSRKKPLSLVEQWLIFLGLTIYSFVMAYSATYSPYIADIALPATQDTLMLICFLGFVFAFIRKDHSWMSIFLVLSFLSLPNGTFLITLWLVSVWLFWKAEPRRSIVLAATVLGGLLSLYTLLPAVSRVTIEKIGLPAPGGEYSPMDLLRQMVHLKLFDWRRILFVVVPCGILPIVLLGAWRSQDVIARCLTILTIAYFGFFYVQSRISLHYFVPAMILPLIIFWRNDLIAQNSRKPIILVSTAACGALALVLSFPKSFLPNTTARLIGAAIEDRIPGYENLDPVAFRSSKLFRRILPYDWDKRVPQERYGGSPLVWYYYAHRTTPLERKEINYVLQDSKLPPPSGMRLVVKEDGAALYLKSESVLAAHRSLRPPTPAGSKLYAISKKTLFGR